MKRCRKAVCLLGLIAVMACTALAHAGTGGKTGSGNINRGRYLVRISGCNDCHTSGFMENNGKIKEENWLTGSPLGWRGPWGTTYPPNLRLFMKDMSVEQWIKTARTIEARPPMPWYNLRAMSDKDLRAIYAVIKKLGPAGEPAPAYLPPDKEPPMPYFQFVAPPK